MQILKKKPVTIIAIIVSIAIISAFFIVQFVPIDYVKTKLYLATHQDNEYMWSCETDGDAGTKVYVFYNTHNKHIYDCADMLVEAEDGHLLNDGTALLYSFEEIRNMTYSSSLCYPQQGAMKDSDSEYITQVTLVPLDCEYALIAGEKIIPKYGKIKTNSGEFEFKTLAFSYPKNSPLATVEKMYLYDTQGNEHITKSK